MLSRRNLFLVGASGVALSACSSLGGFTPTQLQNDSSALVNFATGTLTSALSALGVTLPANLVGDFKTALAGISANASELLDSLGNANTPILQRIMTGLGVVANIATPFIPPASTAFLLLNAAVSLVQFLISSFSPAPAAVLMAPATPSALAAKGLGTMSVGDARHALGEN